MDIIAEEYAKWERDRKIFGGQSLPVCTADVGRGEERDTAVF